MFHCFKRGLLQPSWTLTSAMLTKSCKVWSVALSFHAWAPYDLTLGWMSLEHFVLVNNLPNCMMADKNCLNIAVFRLRDRNNCWDYSGCLFLPGVVLKTHLNAPNQHTANRLLLQRSADLLMTNLLQAGSWMHLAVTLLHLNANILVSVCFGSFFPPAFWVRLDFPYIEMYMFI